MTVQTLWSASFDDGATQVTLTFDDGSLTLQSLAYQNLRAVDYKGEIWHNGAVVRSARLPAGTHAATINLLPFTMPVVATSMPADAKHPAPWIAYDLPAGWSVSLGLFV